MGEIHNISCHRIGYTQFFQTANFACRIFWGTSVENTQDRLDATRLPPQRNKVNPLLGTRVLFVPVLAQTDSIVRDAKISCTATAKQQPHNNNKKNTNNNKNTNKHETNERKPVQFIRPCLDLVILQHLSTYRCDLFVTTIATTLVTWPMSQCL